jgi:hypothetical protein
VIVGLPMCITERIYHVIRAIILGTYASVDNFRVCLEFKSWVVVGGMAEFNHDVGVARAVRLEGLRAYASWVR